MSNVRRVKIIIMLLLLMLLSCGTGCYSTFNSEAVGAIKVKEDQETSTYFIFGFGVVKVVRPVEEDVEIIRDYGLGFGYTNNSKTGYDCSIGLWGTKKSILNPNANVIYEIKCNDDIIIEKLTEKEKK